jgi:hypothetical protein
MNKTDKGGTRDAPVTAAYEQHGVANVSRSSSGEWIGDCPWCASRADSGSKGKQKFCIKSDGELWKCLTCGVSGNAQQFLARSIAHSQKRAGPKALEALGAARGGLRPETLKAWGIGVCNGGYVYPQWQPGANGDAIVSDVRRYKVGGRPMATTGGKAGLMTTHGDRVGDDTTGGTVWLCEGEWDGMAWQQALTDAGIDERVFAVPGASALPQKCLAWLSGKDVVLLYDNDSPGQDGARRAWKKLEGFARSMRRLEWKPGLPDGYDVRDLWKENGCDGKKVVAAIRRALVDVPIAEVTGDPDEVVGAAKGRAAAKAPTMTATARDKIDPDGKGITPAEAIKCYRKWLELDDPEMLDVVFGAVLANRMDVDPLWLFVVGPPGSGKSEMLMSLSDCPMVQCSTGITPHSLISGMNTGGGDPSLLPKLMGRTWVVKDFTTVLSMNQTARDEIFSVLRDAYDGKIEKVFGNGLVRKYEGRFGVVAGVTAKIDGVSAQNVVLGERFIRWRLKPKGRVLVGAKVVMRALDNLCDETRMRDELRKTARRILDRKVSREQYPDIPRWFKSRVVELAQWVASMRGVVERDRFSGSTGIISSKPSTEVATRLAKQFCTLGLGIGVYRGLAELDEAVYSAVASVGRDTCPDRAEEIIRVLYVMGGKGSTRDVAEESRFPYDTARWVLQDLDLLGVVRKERGSDGVYILTEAVQGILDRLKLYSHDKAWRRADPDAE